MKDFNINEIEKISEKMELLKASYAISNHNFHGKDSFVAEFGVYTGTSINNMAKYVVEDKIYGFDSFEGLPEDWRTGYPKGHFSTNLGELTFDEKVIIYPGWFNESVPNFLNDVLEPAKFISVDCDIYSSAKYVLTALKSRIIPGTIIFFDEFYNYPGYEQHEYKAFYEFVDENNVKFDFLYVNPNHEQVSVEIKEIS